MANSNVRKNITDHLSLALTDLQMLAYINFVILKSRSRSRCITFVMASLDGKYMTSYSITIVMFSLSPIVYASRAKQQQKFDFENEGQGQGLEKRELRDCVGLFFFVRFQNFSNTATCAHTLSHPHKERKA